MAFGLKYKFTRGLRADSGLDVAGVFLLAIVAGACCYWLLPEHPVGVWATSLVAGLASVALVAAPRDARFSSLVTIVAATLVLTYTVRPAILIQPFTLSLATEVDLTGLQVPRLLAMGFVVLVAAGAWASRWRRCATLRNSRSTSRLRPRARVEMRGPRSVMLAALVTGTASVALLVASLWMAGMSLGAAYQSPVLFRAATSSGGRYYLSGVCIALAWAPFWVGLVSKGLWSRWRRAMFLTAALLLAVFVTYPFGQRSYFLAPVLGAFAWRELTKRRVRAVVVVPAGVGVLAALGLYSTWRAMVGGVPGTNVSVSGTALNVSARLDSFDFFAQTYQTFENRLLYGRSVIDLVLQPIPRSFYPDKPSQTSAYLIGLQQPESGRTFTPEYGLISELWINGGLALLVLGAFAVGWWLVSADKWILLSAWSPRRALVTLPFISIPAQWMLAGVNSFATIYLCLFGAIYWAVASMVTRRVDE